MKLGTAACLLSLLAALAACDDKKSASSTDAAKTQAETGAATEAEALTAGVEAVVYGLPLVLTDITKGVTANVEKPEGFAAPVNQFVHVRAFPDASFKDVVRANVDTLYSSAFLDLAAEPIVLSAPDTRGRYYLLPMLDAWTNVFASPGKRTTGTKPAHFAVTGPGWRGTLPKGVTEIKAPTNLVWIIGRTQTNGPQDYPAVHKIQDGYRLAPLSSFGKPYAPPPGRIDPAIDRKTPPVEQVRKMSAAAFFNRLAALLKANPPPAADAPMLDRLKKIGIAPGEPFEPAKLDADVARGLEKSVAAAFEKLDAAAKETGAPVNGWRVPPANLGRYGVDYAARAVVALVGLGANLPQDAVYPSAFTDSDGAPLQGANKYVLHFDKGATPPARAFWSVTAYDAASFFIPNPINRYAVSSWAPLKKNRDGSLDIYVQRESPGKEREMNWLPVGDAAFNLTLRMYWPEAKKPSILDGSWRPPAVLRGR